MGAHGEHGNARWRQLGGITHTLGPLTAAVPKPSGTRDWFPGRQFLHGRRGGRDGSGGNVSDGEQWGAADEASPARPPLSSCCAARFLTDWSAAGGLGTPALWDQARPLRGSLRGIAPLLSSLPFPASLQVSPGSTFSRNPLHRDPHSRGCFQGPHLRPESTYQAKQCAGG